MGMRFHGTSVISWSQTEVDGIPAAPASALTAGAVWRWTGTATRVDGAGDTLLLEGATGAEELHCRAARKVRRLVGLPASALPHKTHDIEARIQRGAEQDRALHREPGLVLTDGLRAYTAIVLSPPASAARLLVFAGALPPEAQDLWVVRTTIGQDASADGVAEPGGLVCFTPGTRIATPQGARPVERLVPGDLVLTRDDGPQPVVWTGDRHISGARLFAMPGLRPIRLRAGALDTGVPDGDLLVSPRHRVLLRGPSAQTLFNTPEVLVSAGDLVDDRAIAPDRSLREVTYIHFLLERHAIVWANGVESESFHPSDTGLEGIEPGQRPGLLQALPALAQDRLAYGEFARRSLSAPEAAILCHDRRPARHSHSRHFAG